MRFAAPLWLAAAGGLSLLVVALHLLSRRSPRPLTFPTTRFIPELSASAPVAARRPSDLPLLLLRIAVLLLLGLAFARPQATPPRRTAALVLLDRSRAAPAKLDDSLVALLRSASLVLAFDSVARPWSAGAPGDTSHSSSRGSLSVALIAAVRHAPTLASTGDSLALHIVSPFAVEERDEATIAIRHLWRGGITLHVTPAAAPQGSNARMALGDDDPLAAALTPEGGLSAEVRLTRSRPTATDSSWAMRGGTLVYWPRRPGDAGWEPGRRDTVGGIFSTGHAVAAPFERLAHAPEGTSAARWSDGIPAATARPLGAGCQRDVAIPTDLPGDVMLRHEMRAIVRELTAPCGGERKFHQLALPVLDSLRAAPGLMATAGLTSPVTRQVPANGWLLAAALLLLAAEPLARRNRNSR